MINVKNIEFYEKKNCVEFIPLDGKLDAVTSSPSTKMAPILESKQNSGKSIKISFNFLVLSFLIKQNLQLQEKSMQKNKKALLCFFTSQ